MMEMYGKLHQAFQKVVYIVSTGKRYLATYFRVAFYGRVSEGGGWGVGGQAELGPNSASLIVRVIPGNFCGMFFFV